MKVYKIKIQYKSDNFIEEVLAKYIHIENGKIYIKEVCDNEFWIYFDEFLSIEEL